jgi:hypothetical protein
VPEPRNVQAEKETATERHRLPLARLGKPNTYLHRQTQRFYRVLEEAVLAAHGRITVSLASRIHTAALALRQCVRIDRILADAGEAGLVGFTERTNGQGAKVVKQTGLFHADWLAYHAALLRAEQVVDHTLAALDLDKGPADVWDVYHASLAHDAASAGGDETSERPPINAQTQNVAEETATDGERHD